MYQPADWSVFRRAIRTNNDTEGWHHHLNSLTDKTTNSNVFELIEVLHKESLLVSTQSTLICEEKFLKGKISEVPKTHFQHLAPI